MSFDEIIELKSWLRTNERSMSWLGRKCNVSPASVKGWLDKKHYPARKHRICIWKVTGVRI